MTKWDCLLTCVYISNNSSIPLEELWWDNQLTLVGTFAVISLYIGVANKVIKEIRSKNESRNN